MAVERTTNVQSMDLGEALEKAALVYENERRSPADPAALAEHWGFSASSSGWKTCIASLKKFGLLEEAGDGKGGRRVRLTALALKILLSVGDEHEHEKREAIKQAALAPRIFRDIWEKYDGELPSTASLRTYLVRDLGFNEDAANKTIKALKATIEFAELTPNDRISGVVGDPEYGSGTGSEGTGAYADTPTGGHTGVAHLTIGKATLHGTAHSIPAPSAASKRPWSIPLGEEGRTVDFMVPPGFTDREFDFFLKNLELWRPMLVVKRPETVGGEQS